MKPLDIESMFKFHPATTVTADKHDIVRTVMLATARQIELVTPRSPEQTLALRSMQEAMFWANAAIAMHQEQT